MNEHIIAVCTSCGAKNRIAKDRIADKPVCGKCKAPLSVEKVHSRPLNITDSSFSSEVLSYPGAVLVDCWAPWCGPCKMIAPVLDELAKDFAGKVKITKLNVDENQATASRYGIQSIPTMLLFKNGQQVDTLVGALPKMEIAKRLQTMM